MKRSAHVPVLLKQSVEFLNVEPGGTYVDLTLGGGGHSLEILKLLKQTKHSKLICFDQDESAIQRFGVMLEELGYKSEELNSEIKVCKSGQIEVYLVNRNFDKLTETLIELGIKGVNGILADLGLSTDQLDNSGKGFSFKKDEPLDMRMSEKLNVKASDLLKVLGEKELAKIFWEYGDEINSKRIAKAIVQERNIRLKRGSGIETTQDLLKIINESASIKSRRNLRDLLPATRVFQALRIAVNREIDSLFSVLPQMLEFVVAGSRIVIISFHSGEDRLVKNFNRKSKEEGLAKIITKKPVRPSDEEIQKNNRSRSAKMRVLEKL